MEYKKQHFITEAYIRAWCDNKTSNGAFVWIVSKKNRKILRKSPRSLFSEDDFYTAYDPNGNRILALEYELKVIEDKFILLRDKKLRYQKPLTPEDRKTLALFISTMFARTKRQKEDDQQIWQDYIQMVETLPPKLSTIVKNTRDYKDVIRVHKNQPMLFHLFQFVNTTAPYLFQMNCAIYETKSSPGLITSDNPCFWFDPAVYNPYTPLTYFGTGSPTLNIIFPISPKQYISLEPNGPDGYINLHTNPETEVEAIDLVNGLTATNCDEFIVVNQKTFKEKWFDVEGAQTN